MANAIDTFRLDRTSQCRACGTLRSGGDLRSEMCLSTGVAPLALSFGGTHTHAAATATVAIAGRQRRRISLVHAP
jgi:hypothetical protein